MANTTIYPFGTGGQLPSSIGIINDLTTGGADKALSAEMGKQLNNKYKLVNADDIDFAIADDDGNVLVEFVDGHVMTKEFDSATTKSSIQTMQTQISNMGSSTTANVGLSVKEDDDAVLDFADPAGHVVMRIDQGGNIKTKGFDSQSIDLFRQLKLGQPQCICHGYGSAEGVANTLSYYRDGIAKGYKFFEVDAVNCSDGIPVCTHSAGSYEVYGKNDTTKTKVTVNFSTMTSSEVVSGYTWTPPTVENGEITAYGEPIALLSDVIWYICYFHRFPLHVDGQGMTKASRLAASQYAESLGVGQYVFHEVTPYTDWAIPCNCIVGVTSASQVTSYVALYKKSDNNLLFSMSTTGPNALDPTDADDATTIQAICAAAKAAGCYTEIWTIYSASTAKKWFSLGVDFIITAGVTNGDI